MSHFAGSLPPAWLAHASAWSANVSVLDVSFNDLNGSLPADAVLGGSIVPGNPTFNGTAAATVMLDPMNAGYGLCGALPDGIYAVSATSGGRRLQGTLPSGPCNNTGKVLDLTYWRSLARTAMEIGNGREYDKC